MRLPVTGGSANCAEPLPEEAEAVLKTIPLQDQDTRYQLAAQIELFKQAAGYAGNSAQLQQQSRRIRRMRLLATQLALQRTKVGRNEAAPLELPFVILRKDLTAAEDTRKTFREILAAPVLKARAGVEIPPPVAYALLY